ncbi:hypothetical protein MP228_006912 [Amoeboaphelidium protococcarum]|nr:hypothetical protein MP228_006912 [Amoeboaphelidium protococcarum]
MSGRLHNNTNKATVAEPVFPTGDTDYKLTNKEFSTTAAAGSPSHHAAIGNEHALPPVKAAPEEKVVVKAKEMLGAARDQRMPTTRQASEMLKEVQNTLSHAHPVVSTSGKQVLGSTEHLLETTRRLLVRKNPDDTLQEFLYHARLASAAMANSPTMKQGVKGAAVDAKDEVKEFIDLITLFVQSSEFRSALSDLTEVVQDLLDYILDLGQDALNITSDHVAQGVKEVQGDVQGKAQDVLPRVQTQVERSADQYGDVAAHRVGHYGNQAAESSELANRRVDEEQLTSAQQKTKTAANAAGQMLSSAIGMAAHQSKRSGEKDINEKDINSGVSSSDVYGSDPMYSGMQKSSGDKDLPIENLHLNESGRLANQDYDPTHKSGSHSEINRDPLAKELQSELKKHDYGEPEIAENKPLAEGKEDFGRSGVDSGVHSPTGYQLPQDKFQLSVGTIGEQSGYDQFSGDQETVKPDWVESSDKFYTAHDEPGMASSQQKQDGISSAEMSELARDSAQKAQGVAKTHAKELKRELRPKLDELIAQLKAALLRLHSRDNFQRAVDKLLELYNEVALRLSSVVDNSKAQVSVPSDAERHMQIARQKAIEVIENFTNYSLSTMVDAYTELQTIARNDTDGKVWFDRLVAMITLMLKDSEYVEQEQFRADTEALSRDAEWYAMKYRQPVNTIMQESSNMFQSLLGDRLVRQYAADWNDLMVTLFLDQDGTPTIKPELIGDIPRLVKFVLDRISVIPIDQVQGSDDQMDYYVDHINIAAAGLTPDDAYLSSESHVHMREGTSSTTVTLDFTVPEILANDIRFWYHKKSFPKMSDSGLLDMKIANIDCRLVITLLPWLNEDVYRIDTCHFKVHTVNLKFEEAKHKTLYKIFNPIMTGRIKSNIQDSLEKNVYDSLLKLERQLAALKQQSKIGLEKRQQALQYGSEPMLQQDKPLPTWGSRSYEVHESRRVL